MFSRRMRTNGAVIGAGHAMSFCTQSAVHSMAGAGMNPGTAGKVPVTCVDHTVGIVANRDFRVFCNTSACPGTATPLFDWFGTVGTTGKIAIVHLTRRIVVFLTCNRSPWKNRSSRKLPAIDGNRIRRSHTQDRALCSSMSMLHHHFD